MVNIKALLAVAGLGVAAMAGPQGSAQAAQVTLEPLTSIAQQATTANGKVENVGYRYKRKRHNRKWRYICAERWGRHSRRYYRCLRRHDVGHHYGKSRRYGRKWHRICSKRWGSGTWRYRRCLRRNTRY